MSSEKSPSVFDADVQANKAVASLSYMWIFFLVPLLWKRKSKFAQFHAKQGMILFLGEVIVSLIAIRFIDDFLFAVAVIISALGVVKAYNGEWWQVPVIYDLSKKIKL